MTMLKELVGRNMEEIAYGGKVVVETINLSVLYGKRYAIRDISLKVEKNRITAIIGPSGCGKSTFLRCLNRMNDLIPDARVEGKVLYRGLDIYSREVDPVAVRTVIGMVFQRPNPFPMSIFDNVAFGLRGERCQAFEDGAGGKGEGCLGEGGALGRGKGQA
jgi:ABC-type phosphate transport system ATPase subunit